MSDYGYQYMQRADLSETSELYRDEVQELLKRVPTDGLILDFGCNTGRFIELARRTSKRTARFIGVDVNQYALTEARKRHPSAQFFSSLGTLPDDSIDAVVIIHVLPHLQPLDVHLANVWRVLKPGGSIHVLVFNKWNDRARRIANFWRKYKSDPTIVRAFDLRDLRQTMRVAGFRQENLYAWGRGWPKDRLIFHGTKPYWEPENQ